MAAFGGQTILDRPKFAENRISHVTHPLLLPLLFDILLRDGGKLPRPIAGVSLGICCRGAVLLRPLTLLPTHIGRSKTAPLQGKAENK
jgi:hypothetical protein